MWMHHLYSKNTLHNISSDQKTQFTMEKNTSLSPRYGIRWSYYISHHPKIAGLTEQWNGVLKFQLQN